jgi:hypothetical protein
MPGGQVLRMTANKGWAKKTVGDMRGNREQVGMRNMALWYAVSMRWINLSQL